MNVHVVNESFKVIQKSLCYIVVHVIRLVTTNMGQGLCVDCHSLPNVRKKKSASFSRFTKSDGV